MAGRTSRFTPFPAEFVTRYRDAGLWWGMTLPAELRNAACRYADLVALVTTEVTWTYRELDERCESFAAGILASTSLEPGDAVMFSMGNVAETVVAYYGCLRAGLIPVCTIPQHREREISLLAAHTGARGHIVQADFGSFDLVAMARAVSASHETLTEVIVARGEPGRDGIVSFERLLAAGRETAARQRLAAVQPDVSSIVAFQLSGGTTGLPKVAPRLHEEFAYNARAWGEAFEWGPGSRVMYALPIMHNAGISGALQPAHLLGATIYLAADADAATILDILRTHRPTSFPVVPPAVAMRLLDHPDVSKNDFASLRDFVIGGQKLTGELADELVSHLEAACRQLFGMAEGTFMLTPRDATDDVRLNTVGKPISEFDEIQIYEPGTEDPVQPGQIGEMCTRGPYTIRGYYKADAHNVTCFTADGFYRTGDLARCHVIDGVSYYSIEGRIKDVISRGVEKIHAEEVEEVMSRHADIHSVAVVAMPDPVLGERTCAFVQMVAGTEPLDVPAVAEFLRLHGLAKYKFPERVEIVDAFPLTNVGKVAKKELREIIAATLEREARQQAASRSMGRS